MTILGVETHRLPHVILGPLRQRVQMLDRWGAPRRAGVPSPLHSPNSTLAGDLYGGALSVEVHPPNVGICE
jgi:hypothetical protein